MTAKIIGAILIIGSCGGYGFFLADAHRKEENGLTQLIQSLEVMICELEFRMPSLGELCKTGAKVSRGSVGQVLNQLANELERREQADGDACMESILREMPKLPGRVKNNLEILGKTLGQFDLQGQITGMRSVVELCKRDLAGLEANRDVRLRGYRTLGLCAGVALVILFL